MPQTNDTKKKIAENAIREYLVERLADFHRARLEGKGYDFFFVLSNDLEKLNNPHDH